MSQDQQCKTVHVGLCRSIYCGSKFSHALPDYVSTFCSEGTIAVTMNGVWGSLALFLGDKGSFKSAFF